jgi:transposase-like protein
VVKEPILYDGKAKYTLTKLTMQKIPDKFNMIKNPQNAVRIFRKLRWKPKLHCVYCGCVDDIRTHSLMKSGLKRYFCPHCGKTFSDTTGTVFSKSRIPMWKWMYVLIILFESTASLSAAEAGRAVKVSYPTALRMMRRIRNSFQMDQFEGKLRGIIESDEGWFSHKDNQQILEGIVERGGSVKFFEVMDRTEISLCFPHWKYVEKGSMVCTDSLASYASLGINYTHHWVNHSKGEFAWRDVHTNTIEGVWGMLKGIIRTIHHGVRKKYLMEYAQLFAFMYSNRLRTVHEKFNLLFHKLCQPRYCLY